VRVNGQLAVGRLGGRSDADLAWEIELLQHLDREGLTVPVPNRQRPAGCSPTVWW
jgi:Ser/Thr protein kinase RdoA (MazF antagonist)